MLLCVRLMEMRCWRRRRWLRRPHVEPFALSNAIRHVYPARRCRRGSTRPLPPDAAALELFALRALNYISKAARRASRKRLVGDERAREATREYRALEGIDGHELCRLAHLLRDA